MTAEATAAPTLPGYLEGVYDQGEVGKDMLDALASVDELGNEEREESEEVSEEDELAEDLEDEIVDEAGEDDLDLDDEDILEEEEEKHEEEEEEEKEEVTFEVTLPGGEKAEISVAELTASYSREADYTRKSQAREAEHAAAIAETQDVRAKLIEMYDQVEKTLETPEVDWDALREEDPTNFAATWAQHQQVQAARAEVEKAKAAEVEEYQKEQLKIQEAHIEEEWGALVSAVPVMKDQEKARILLDRWQAFAKEQYGFSDRDLQGVTNHKLLLMLRDNYNANRRKAKASEVLEKGKKPKKRTRTLKPGARAAPKSRSRVRVAKKREAAFKQLEASGSEAAGRAFIESLLGDED